VLSDSRSLGAVISDAVANVRGIVRGELRLAGAELIENFRPFQAGVILLAFAAVSLIAALGYVAIGAWLALALVLPAWAAALVMAGIALALAGVFAALGWRRFRHVRGFPRTLTSLQDATRWPQHSTR
jgi:membrane protein